MDTKPAATPLGSTAYSFSYPLYNLDLGPHGRPPFSIGPYLITPLPDYATRRSHLSLLGRNTTRLIVTNAGTTQASDRQLPQSGKPVVTAEARCAAEPSAVLVFERPDKGIW